MPRRTMRVLPEGDLPLLDRAIMEPRQDAPIFKGVGTTDYLCGQCGAVLLESIDPARWGPAFIHCKCGAMNEMNT